MRRPRPLLLTLSFALAATFAACGGPNTFTEGTICLTDPTAVASFVPGDDLEFEVILDPCMSCPERFESSCDVELEGDTIVLHARGTWDKSRAVGCASVCLELSTTCKIVDLPAGTYTVVSGDNELTLTLPSAEPVQQDEDCS